MATLGNYHLLNSGTHTHMLLHANRDEFDGLLTEFIAGQPFHTDPIARALFELDLLARPYVYREYPRLPQHTFTELTVTQHKRTLEITAPPEAVRVLHELGELPEATDAPLTLSHPLRRKLPFRDDQPLHDNISYCQGMTVHLREMLPERTVQVPAPAG